MKSIEWGSISISCNIRQNIGFCLILFSILSALISTNIYSFHYMQCYYHHKYLLLLDIVWCRNKSIVIALWNKIARNKLNRIQSICVVCTYPTAANYIKTIDPSILHCIFILFFPFFSISIFLFRISIVMFAAGSQTMFTDFSVFVTFSNSHKHYTAIQVKLTKRTQIQCLNECKEFYKWYLGRIPCEKNISREYTV